MSTAKFEMHISRQARDKYQFDESLFHSDGNAIVGNFQSARLFASRINEKRDLLNYPESAAKASELFAIGLMDEIFHFVVNLYKNQIKSDVWDQALEFTRDELSEEDVETVIIEFLKEFPPTEVYQKKQSLSDYLERIEEQDQLQLIIEEVLMLWIENQNPALGNYSELFYDQLVQQNSPYAEFINEMYVFFDENPPFGPDLQNLIDMLRAPAVAVPNSIPGQLDYIRTRWAGLLGDLLYRLLSSLDFIREEEKAGFTGPGPIPVPDYEKMPFLDVENFSPDRDWMPSLVMIAKNSHVWLDQLSRKYQREIKRLDQIPDEELDLLHDRGFSGLWLIGLWERSTASARIKQLCGNPEAIASAYSLASYEISNELGGDSSYRNLRERAWQRGIRLASDMVPNHMGIDSNWVYDHPDWFIQLDYSPYPSYSFEGPNLSSADHIEIKIEDHYYDRTDAAVVFRYHNRHSGQTRFIYHGNDGTTMPWNDTAQLNYLMPEVREAVYQTILSVAKRFPIIRFDAAMTLAKKHYQRLWFPEPGTGGAIPSRAEFGMTKDEFDRMLPNEFWREVVDRLAVDAPDTLLLAEAFWLMESYFVRTLGMHRVYNSAFMNMLRNEDNANYRKLIKNTLEFDPQILKRFVNFMNNPDEKTAVEQFGKGDKYFGICVLMVTLPGLPMFGHGQIEGYAEKYGMEYKRAYWDEMPDDQLIHRHNRQIFPLLHRRWIFADVEQFQLYDFFSTDHYVNEDVYAYSNYANDQASLVIYNNKYGNANGWIKYAAPFQEKTSDGQKVIRQRTIFEGLHLDLDNEFLIFRDSLTNLEYIRPVSDISENGLYFELNAYQTHVFMDFKQIKDNEWHTYRQLSSYLGGRGVPNIENALRELLLQPVQQPFREISNRGYMDYLYAERLDKEKTFLLPAVLNEAQQKSENLIKGVYNLTGYMQHKDIVVSRIIQYLDFALSLPAVDQKINIPGAKTYKNAVQELKQELESDFRKWLILFHYTFIAPLGSLATPLSTEFQSQSWYSEWQFAKLVRETSHQYGYSEDDQQLIAQTVFTIIGETKWYQKYQQTMPKLWFKDLLSMQSIQQYLQINRYQGKLWFNKERFENLIWWLYLIAYMEIGSNPKVSATMLVEETIKLYKIVSKLRSAMEASEYQVDLLLENFS